MAVRERRLRTSGRPRGSSCQRNARGGRCFPPPALRPLSRQASVSPEIACPSARKPGRSSALKPFRPVPSPLPSNPSAQTAGQQVGGRLTGRGTPDALIPPKQLKSAGLGSILKEHVFCSFLTGPIGGALGALPGGFPSAPARTVIGGPLPLPPRTDRLRPSSPCPLPQGTSASLPSSALRRALPASLRPPAGRLRPPFPRLPHGGR